MLSRRLSFRHYSDKDFYSYFQLVSNEEVMRMILGRPLLKDEARVRFNDMIAMNMSNSQTGHFMVIDRGTSKNMGHAKLVMTESNQAEIGYLILPEYWKHGYGTEIAEALVKRSKMIAEIECLIAIIDPQNVVSRKILEKQGFIFDYEGMYYGLPAIYFILELSNKNRK